MKIKILNFNDVKEVQEILRDLGIKQPTYGYSDVFTVPDNEDEYVFDIFKQKNIKWEKMSRNESYLRKSVIKENAALDSDYLQRQLKILADDVKRDEPELASAYLFLQHRLYQSFPDGDVSREEIEDLLHEPQGRKYLQNMPEWAIDQLFESKSTRKKIIKESKLSRLINQIIKEEVRRVRLKESSSQQEIEDLAIDLIDYMGKELPLRPNQRILRWFEEAGITDENLIKQIYQKALKLNAE
jgi:hypothetical protein